MTSTRRNYPAALKVKIALAALREDTPLSDLSVKFGVHATVINRWKREALQSLEEGFKGKTERVAKDHTSVLKELHAKIGELIIEKDFLEQVWGRSGIKGAKK
jgi:transposase